MFLVHGEEKVRNGVLQWDVIVCAISTIIKLFPKCCSKGT